MLTEFGLGTSLRRGDYTEAVKRAIEDALWHNSINFAELFGFEKTDMRITVDIGVQKPDEVDTTALSGVFPYGSPEFVVKFGGLDIPSHLAGRPPTIMANVALSVAFDMEPANA